jgi:Cu2+-exporting ATPase
MTCCASGIGLDEARIERRDMPGEIALSSKDLGGGLRQTTLSVPGMHCAACIRAIERALSAVDGVSNARANLSMRRVVVTWRSEGGRIPDLAGTLADIGYAAHLPNTDMDDEDGVQSHLVRALAVAGFCSMNIMLFSVSVWAGADENTRRAFHLLSAALALPAIVYSGTTFYLSAWRALSKGRVNMDVPISAGVLLSFALSLYDGLTNAPQTYFEAATSLLFVLLAGRLLDHVMRRKARSAVAGLERLMPRGANLVTAAGTIDYVPLPDIRAGMRLLVPAGERVPTDGVVAEGRSEMDSAHLTGESLWRTVDPGGEVRAGEVVRGGPIVFTASVAPEHSLLSKMTQMLAAAEDGRSRYRRVADRAASLYAPLVHSLSALAFAGWLYASRDIHTASTVAIAVLVITCPCALGLAVPMVQVVLTRRLFERGVMAADGSALERLHGIDTVVFDKTGTLTSGRPALLNPDAISGEHLALAGTMARQSRHPLSMALSAAQARSGLEPVALDHVEEVAGLGMEAAVGSDIYRLGRAEWATGHAPRDTQAVTSVMLSRNGDPVATFAFGETIRPGAAEAVRALKARGIDVRIMSGDRQEAVAKVARAVGIETFSAGLLPGGKVAAIGDLQAGGRKVLMVGDGINDAPALRAAHVSMAPSSASDIGRNAADLVFFGDHLSVIPGTLDAVALAGRLVRQNLALAALYNAISLPIAFAGYVTPLMAAVAMSTSSILVVLNALRLASRDREESDVVAAPGRAMEVPA